MIGQNRQYQVFSSPTYIYPVVPAYAATLLKQAGHEVIWNDCIAEGWSYQQFLDFVKNQRPDMIVFETKTPVIKHHWRIISDLKVLLSAVSCQLLTVLCGDHVTALPEESMMNSPVDYILTGGDYDFLLVNLCRSLAQKREIVPVVLEPGIWFRDKGTVRNTGLFKLNHDLNSLPMIDRELTRWESYAYKNGNFKRTPGTYIMAGRDCWYHQCTFCSWPTLYPEFRSRGTTQVLDEIGSLIERYRVAEIMDDTGTFPVGSWLKDFCSGMIERGYNRKVYLDCNMRFGVLSFEELQLMKKANFRLILFGLESACQSTLDRIHKNVTVDQIVEGCRLTRKAGLFPHITIMFGYPWESYEDALKTLELGKRLLKKGYAYTMQATVVIPYPGSPLFKECRENDLLKTLDWSRYDMKEPVMMTSMPDEKLMGLVRRMYNTAFMPQLLFRRIASVRDLDDLKYFARAGAKVMGHVFDFKGRNREKCISKIEHQGTGHQSTGKVR
jgi:radical SAM superfamily enzyme YgiQ (UPF0313 family)